ncbi:CDP-glucose 4,6-dehydratase [Thiovibrio frasassiensis]|uniref:CDP-glucose 4,6-dehydratase n=1 Tax=Thiovibrio frasassiensis TaxID=2984131 RepID=A0A9X4MC00_9BACT|nr:CDP-glucose 4,6-dehydratase [Thiovibrio frasassiensis]MDG4474794.1 CDP-glucose 4,6-dehydratase [Thiovibrio frasassiensis]
MENLVMMNPSYWQGRSVLVTGHTGFKGGWLTLWLHRLGAKIHGYSLDPPTTPSLFEVANIAPLLDSHTLADLANLAQLQATFRETQPEVVFHLAAQPLVREGYRDPLGTLASNVMGTAHVLEVARMTASVHAIVIITTDKVYENREWEHPYREIDPLGGHDPYSASKAAAEIVTASYRASYFGQGTDHSAQLATVRAGNVIGGGDWAADRLVPDCLRAFAEDDTVRLRFPRAMRPWQHVLEPLAGYLLLAEQLLSTDGKRFAKAWNFGPDTRSDVTVGEVAEATARYWGKDASVEYMPLSDHPHEARLLRLDSTQARCELGWQPRWSLQHALEQTVAWHRTWLQGADMAAYSLEQIRAYEEHGQP